MVIERREGKCCDAVIRQMERAAEANRTAVSDPERSGEGPRVDLRVTLREREYALEHTRVLPFGDRIKVATAYHDIKGCLDQWGMEPLPGDAFYELHLPLSVRRPGRGKTGESRREGLHAWIRSAVDLLQARAPARPRRPPHVYDFDLVRSRPECWDCEFTLARSSEGVLPPRRAGSLTLFVGSPDDPESPFVKGLQRAFGDKCPKLARCKELDPDILTVLILEAVDLPLQHDLYIAKQLGGLLAGVSVAPDRVFLVCPHDALWQVWVVKSGDIQWPDERLPMPHRGYQDPPRLVPERAYPKALVDRIEHGSGREIPVRWRPLLAAASHLDDIKQCGTEPAPAS